MSGAVGWGLVVFVGPTGSEAKASPIGGDGVPDLAVLDGLARAQLVARRLGGYILLREVCRELEELLDLAGLGGELSGKPEGGEELLGVQEGVEPGDPVA